MRRNSTNRPLRSALFIIPSTAWLFVLRKKNRHLYLINNEIKEEHVYFYFKEKINKCKAASAFHVTYYFVYMFRPSLIS